MIKERSFLIGILLTSSLCLGAAAPIINWGSLKNPMQLPHVVSTKQDHLPSSIFDNPGLYYENGWYYVYYDHGGLSDESQISESEVKPAHNMYKTKDFLNFEKVFVWNTAAPYYPNVYMLGSADMVKHNGVYYQTYQTWEPDPKFLIYAHTTDINNWNLNNCHLSFAKNILSGRDIDPALAFHNSKVYMIWKNDIGGSNSVPEMAVNPTGDISNGSWKKLGRPKYLDSKGNMSYFFAENYQLIKIGSRWRMVAADTDENFKFNFFTMKQDGNIDTDWLNWERARIDLPNESGRDVDHFRSVYVADWRFIDGYFYAIWASRYTSTTGFGGIIHWARSKDLKNWFLPGNVGKTPNSVSSQVPPDLGTGAVTIAPVVNQVHSVTKKESGTRVFTIRGQELSRPSSLKNIPGITVRKDGSKISKTLLINH